MSIGIWLDWFSFESVINSWISNKFPIGPLGLFSTYCCSLKLFVHSALGVIWSPSKILLDVSSKSSLALRRLSLLHTVIDSCESMNLLVNASIFFFCLIDPCDRSMNLLVNASTLYSLGVDCFSNNSSSFYMEFIWNSKDGEDYLASSTISFY